MEPGSDYCIGVAQWGRAHAVNTVKLLSRWQTAQPFFGGLFGNVAR